MWRAAAPGRPGAQVAVDPEVAAIREVVITRRKRQARHTTRWLLVAVAVFATLAAFRFGPHSSPPPAAPVAVTPKGDGELTAAEQGRRAGQILLAKGRINDVFACAALVPPAASPAASPTAVPAQQQLPEQSPQREWSNAFIAACLSG